MGNTGWLGTYYMEQLVPTMGKVGWTLDESYSSQEDMINHKPLRNISGGNMGAYDVLREVLDSD